MKEKRLPLAIQRLRQWRERRQQAKIKRLESEIKSLKSQVTKAEKRNAQFDRHMDDQAPIWWEFERLMHFLVDFVKTSNESKKLLTDKDKAELKKHDPEITRRIFERIASTPAAQRDREKNAALYKSLETGSEVTRIRNIMPHLEDAIRIFKSFTGSKPARKRISKNETEFWDAIRAHKIDPEKSISEIMQSLNPKGFDFKRTSIHKYISKSRSR